MTTTLLAAGEASDGASVVTSAFASAGPAMLTVAGAAVGVAATIFVIRRGVAFFKGLAK